MTPVSLQAFLHEYRITFPVAVDKAGTATSIPQTMQAYAMRGSPTLTLIDATGLIRYEHFGQASDLLLGAQIAELVVEATASRQGESVERRDLLAVCAPDGCAVPAS